jgi:5-methylcytosine-specific restriction endonuclease McrA
LELKEASEDDMANCKHCGAEFEKPAHPKGGRPKLFCSEPCTQSAWAKAHPDVIRARRKRTYARDGARIKAKSAAWQRQNPEKKRANQSAFEKTENGKLARKSIAHRRRSRKLNNGDGTVRHFTKAEFRLLCEATGCVCLACRKSFPMAKLEADHIVALSNGGHNGIGNIQPLCRHCNADKGDETMNWMTVYALEGVVLNEPAQYGGPN